jgi:DNA-binding transcriptional regulator YiaG
MYNANTLKTRKRGEFDLEKARLVLAPEYISGIRKKLGLTQSEFADRFGLSRRTVQEWESRP